MAKSQWGRRSFRKKDVDCRCGHPHLCHYTKDGHCVYEGCPCKEYKGAGRPEFSNIKKARCEYGHAHNSGLEIKTCFDLYCLKQAGQIRTFEAEVLTELLGPSKAVVATYKVDFVVYHKDNTVEYVECKGKHLEQSGEWRLKWKLLQDKHVNDPKYRFRVERG